MSPEVLDVLKMVGGGIAGLWAYMKFMGAITRLETKLDFVFEQLKEGRQTREAHEEDLAEMRKELSATKERVSILERLVRISPPRGSSSLGGE